MLVLRRRMAMAARCTRVAMDGPGDENGLRAWYEQARSERPSLRVVAVLGKTEGNGCVNDFTRELATKVVKSVVGPTVSVMSGGTEGVLCPHLVVLSQSDEPEAESMRLSLGVATTRPFLPEEIGTEAQVEATRDAVLAACADADLDPATSLHWAQIKCPLVTPRGAAEAAARGAHACQDFYESMALSRAASAAGVVRATGEVTEFSNVASTSAGIELDHSEVVVLGMARRPGDLSIIHGVMEDALDAPAVLRTCEAAGLDVGYGQLTEGARGRVAAVLAKSDTASTVRGFRTTMLSDSDINATRHSRAALGGMLAGIFGDTRLFVSGGAELQGPKGGGPFAIVYKA